MFYSAVIFWEKDWWDGMEIFIYMFGNVFFLPFMSNILVFDLSLSSFNLF